MKAELIPVIIFLLFLLAFLVWRWAINYSFEKNVQESLFDNAKAEADILIRNNCEYPVEQKPIDVPMKIDQKYLPPQDLMEKEGVAGDMPKPWMINFYTTYKMDQIANDRPFIGITAFWKEMKKQNKRSLSHI